MMAAILAGGASHAYAQGGAYIKGQCLALCPEAIAGRSTPDVRGPVTENACQCGDLAGHVPGLGDLGDQCRAACPVRNNFGQIVLLDPADGDKGKVDPASHEIQIFKAYGRTDVFLGGCLENRANADIVRPLRYSCTRLFRGMGRKADGRVFTD